MKKDLSEGKEIKREHGSEPEYAYFCSVFHLEDQKTCINYRDKNNGSNCDFCSADTGQCTLKGGPFSVNLNVDVMDSHGSLWSVKDISIEDLVKKGINPSLLQGTLTGEAIGSVFSSEAFDDKGPLNSQIITSVNEDLKGISPQNIFKDLDKNGRWEYTLTKVDITISLTKRQ